MAQEELIAELKKVLDTDKIILGTSRTLKAVKKGNVSKVFMCSNTSTEVKDDLTYYQGLLKSLMDVKKSLPHPWKSF